MVVSDVLFKSLRRAGWICDLEKKEVQESRDWMKKAIKLAGNMDQEYSGDSGVNNPTARNKAYYGSADFPPVVPIETKDWMIFVATCVRRRDPRVARCSRSVDGASHKGL